MNVIAIRPPQTPDLLGTAPADLIDRGEAAQSSRTDAQQRAERIRAGLPVYARMRQDIADAYAHRDWATLGYDSWFGYVEGEFGTELKALTRTERPEAVADLRRQGMSTRQIGTALGVAQTQVQRDLAQVNTNGSPDKVTGADGKTYPATKPQPAPAPEPTPAPTPPPPAPERSAVDEAIARLVPGAAADEEWRGWRRGFMADVHAAYRAMSRSTAAAVAERADDECMAELERVAVELTAFVEEVRALRAAARPDNVRPIRGGR